MDIANINVIDALLSYGEENLLDTRERIILNKELKDTISGYKASETRRKYFYLSNQLSYLKRFCNDTNGEIEKERLLFIQKSDGQYIFTTLSRYIESVIVILNGVRFTIHEMSVRLSNIDLPVIKKRYLIYLIFVRFKKSYLITLQKLCTFINFTDTFSSDTFNNVILKIYNKLSHFERGCFMNSINTCELCIMDIKNSLACLQEIVKKEL